MLFNSHVFIFLFLPCVLAGFFAFGAFNRKLAAAWLTACSLFFYGWWNPVYVGLLMGSILVNYSMGISIVRGKRIDRSRARGLLVFAVVANLALLGYFKYANFFLQNWYDLIGVNASLEAIVLPLGISFFTFTQIAFLVDAWEGKADEYSLTHYALFVTYFPHLIAGPILHHREMMPQFSGSAPPPPRTHFRYRGWHHDLCYRAVQEGGHRRRRSPLCRTGIQCGILGRHADFCRGLVRGARIHVPALL